MSKDTTSEHLRAELKNLADTLEEVLSNTGEKSKNELDKLRSKAQSALKDTRAVWVTLAIVLPKPLAKWLTTLMSMCVKIHGPA